MLWLCVYFSIITNTRVLPGEIFQERRFFTRNTATENVGPFISRLGSWRTLSFYTSVHVSYSEVLDSGGRKNDMDNNINRWQFSVWGFSITLSHLDTLPTESWVTRKHVWSWSCFITRDERANSYDIMFCLINFVFLFMSEKTSISSIIYDVEASIRKRCVFFLFVREKRRLSFSRRAPGGRPTP